MVDVYSSFLDVFSVNYMIYSHSRWAPHQNPFKVRLLFWWKKKDLPNWRKAALFSKNVRYLMWQLELECTSLTKNEFIKANVKLNLFWNSWCCLLIYLRIFLTFVFWAANTVEVCLFLRPLLIRHVFLEEVCIRFHWTRFQIGCWDSFCFCSRPKWWGVLRVVLWQVLRLNRWYSGNINKIFNQFLKRTF